MRAFFDIGVADATSIWLAQFSGGAIHVIDYIEGSGQPLAYYVNELRSRGYEKARCILPLDGVNKNTITGRRYEDHLKDAGFQGLRLSRMRGPVLHVCGSRRCGVYCHVVTSMRKGVRLGLRL